MSEPKITERGFASFDEVTSEYGGGIRAYESSAASAPHVWVNAHGPASLNDRFGPEVEVALHLTVENARRLRDQLSWLVDNHYQENAR